MGGFTGNSSGMRKVLVVFVLAFLAGAVGWCSKSEAAEGLSVSVGQASIGSEVCFDSLLIAQELDEQKWLVTLATHGKGECRGVDVRANMGFGIMRMTRLGQWALGIGAGAWEHGDRAVGPKEVVSRPQLCAHLGIRRYLLRERAVLDFLHCSTGGSTELNTGKNFLAFGVRIP